MPSALSLPHTARRSFDRVAADLRRVLGARFVALVATSTTSSVAFASSITTGDLEALSTLASVWHHDGVDTPLLLTPDEFHRSLDTFPVEYRTFVDRHVVIDGTPPFAAITFSTADLRHACEVQAKGHLIHLRQGWIDAAGHAERVEELLVRSASPLEAILLNVARLENLPSTDESAALDAARAAGLPLDVIRDVLALEDSPELARATTHRLPEYLTAAEQLWAFVDRWRALR